MTQASRLALSALLLAALVAALPLASAQHGPPPGYDDPVVYAQDYAANQTAQAQGDPIGYAGGKATPEALGNESTHAAWLACWTLYAYAEPAEQAADPACAQFFAAPVAVDAPAEATAEVTGTVNGTLNETGADAFLGEALDAVNDTVADPASVLDQVGRIVAAAVTFAQGLIGFVVGIVEGVLGILGLGGKAAATGALDALGGLLGLLELPVQGLDSAASGLGSLVGSTVAAVTDAAAGAADGVASLAGSIADGIASAVGAVAGGLGSLGRGLADGASAGASAVGGAVSGAAHAVGDAVQAVGHAVASLFDGHESSGAGPASDGPVGGVRTGTEADGLLDRVLKLA
jgi:hypothetical protein